MKTCVHGTPHIWFFASVEVGERGNLNDWVVIEIACGGKSMRAPLTPNEARKLAKAMLRYADVAAKNL